VELSIRNDCRADNGQKQNGMNDMVDIIIWDSGNANLILPL